ncbi:MAG: beta-lactamase family protein [Roseburia sp.]|nr:beta-lactamase family protein [Roseburia sp.]MCM1202049.1 beta-lactamase family protein [Bacteroides fragilis]
MNFDAFVKDIEYNRWNVHGIEVYEDGQLVYRYGDTISRFPIYSATKTITSIAAGIACDHGIFDLEKTVLAYLPPEITAQMSGEQTAAFEQITIQRLLTMSVDGFPFRPEGASYLADSLSCPVKNVRIRTFHYSNIPAYLVGVALTHAINEDLFQYLNRNLFLPLHIVDPVCKRCPDGYFYGASGMEMSVHDLSRIGLLLYHGGVCGGKRIVSEEYVKKASSVQQMNREGGYGYFLWKYRDGFSINGKWQQKCYILPERKLVITCLSHIEEESCGLSASMEKNLLDVER